MTGHVSRRKLTSPHNIGWTLAVATFRFVGRFLRGTMAAVVLVALVAGLPWALVYFVGWPLPDHVPTWDELQALLLAPMTPEFLLDVLACVLWLLWARFAFDVVAAIPEMVRAVAWSSGSRRGPLHAVAGVLVSAIVVSLLSSRTTTSIAPAKIAAAEFATGERAAAVTALYLPVAGAAAENRGITPEALHTTVAVQSRSTEVVRYPERGVHDSLWRMAERCLGDGARWPEIWALNKNTVQVDGRMFATPALIHPGWELRLPVPPSDPGTPVDEQPPQPDAPNRESPGHDPDGQQHGPHTQTPPPGQLIPTAPPDAAHAVPDTSPGISTSTGAFVGIGLAALITIALMTVRLHRRRRYQPGVSAPDDLGGTPVVRALRIAHDVATLSLADFTPATPVSPDGGRHPDLETRDRARATARAVLPTQDETVLGVCDGHAVALNVARSRGLGLTGPGAHAAARALIVSVLARTAADDGAQIVMPVADARAVFGTDLPPRSSHLRVVDNLAVALDMLEAELLTRTRRAEHAQTPHEAPLVLVATPTADTERRTQAILDNGSVLNIAGLLLGQWRAGGTLRVRSDGTVGATSPNLAEQLPDAQLFTLPSTDAADLLALLSDADNTCEPTASDGAERPGNTPATADETSAQDTAHGGDYDFLRDEPPEGTITASIEKNHSVHPAPAAEPQAASTSDTPPLDLQMLGRLHLTHRGTEPADIIDALAPRQREILVYLALHRDGCRRESLTTALWPDAPGDRPYNSFHATLSQLRRALRNATSDPVSSLVVNEDGHYRLDPSIVTVDLWRLQDALRTRRLASTQHQKIAALRLVPELFRGDLAEAIAADWIDAPRESLRREVLDALSVMIRAVADDPEQMLTLLEQARGMDPYNEAIYRDIMRVQARLGRPDSIPRTLGLLIASLADLDQRPARDTVGLADRLRRSPASQQRGRRAS